jgi:hypothetical protein
MLDGSFVVAVDLPKLRDFGSQGGFIGCTVWLRNL